jgi:hypothetical protein
MKYFLLGFLIGSFGLLMGKYYADNRWARLTISIIYAALAFYVCKLFGAFG